MMNILTLNNELTTSTFPDRDVLSVFKQHSEKTTTIQQGMTPNEISDVVSEKVIAVVKEQFEAIKIEFETKEHQ